MKNFVVSDIHDHYDLLTESLNRNGFDINNEDDKETIDTYSTRDIIKYTSSNNEEVSYLKTYRLYMQGLLHQANRLQIHP